MDVQIDKAILAKAQQRLGGAGHLNVSEEELATFLTEFAEGVLMSRALERGYEKWLEQRGVS